MAEDLIRLCSLGEIPDPGSHEFSWGEGGWPLELFVVRQGARAFAYLNRCPHAGHALNWQSDRFLTAERDLILCQSHGARFTIAEGLCVLGPCPGASLKSISVFLRDGDVLVSGRELEALKVTTEI
jgi:nitrite reductase/ring-hydroxylating ferredoxin subunit